MIRNTAEVLSAGSFLLEGAAVRVTARLVHQALEDRRRAGGADPIPFVLELDRRLQRAAAMSSRGQEDVLLEGDPAESVQVNWMGSADVAVRLERSRRQVSRLAVRLNARRGPRDSWLFDPVEVEAFAAEQKARG